MKMSFKIKKDAKPGAGTDGQARSGDGGGAAGTQVKRNKFRIVSESEDSN